MRKSGLLRRSLPGIAPIPNPHPLDFDWRFDVPTIERLAAMLRGRRVIALGTPSVARRLEQLGEDVVLVDRQPLQGVRNHIVADIPTLRPTEGDFDVAIADPPWHPQDFIEWGLVAARAVGVEGSVLITSWPKNTRPKAAYDLDIAIENMAAWACCAVRGQLSFEAPRFERNAITISGNGPLSRSPRIGHLLELKVLSVPPLSGFRERDPIWTRFAVDSYQLAVRLGIEEVGGPILEAHPSAVGWRWPYVSSRAPGLSLIGMWSSENEVAKLRSSARALAAVRAVLHSRNTEEFERALVELPELRDWNLPRPPYRSLIEWQHP